MQNIKVAVDAVVFGYKESKLYVLLINQKYGPFQNTWCLPGGLVDDKETLNQAVRRELKEETGITVKYLEQLYTFGDDVLRDPRNRVISVSYLALVNATKFNPKAATDAQDVNWFELNKVPKLGFDHKLILKKAISRLKAKLNYQPIGFDLLEKEFPFSDLERLYTAILEKPLDRRNFRKKVLGYGFLEETGKLRSEGAGRPGMLYRFNAKKYKDLVEQGIYFEIKYV